MTVASTLVGTLGATRTLGWLAGYGETERSSNVGQDDGATDARSNYSSDADSGIINTGGEV